MEIVINFDDMSWAAIGPELIIMLTAFFILLAGLKKEMDTLPFLSGVSLVGIGAALLFTLSLWGGAPTVENGGNPSMFSGALIHDRFSLTFNLIFLLMSLFAVFGSARYPQESHENKAEGDLFGIGSVDLLLIGKPALNTMFFVDIEAIGGFSPDTTISNISVLNSDNARRTNDRELNIREAWMKLELFEQQLSLYGGMLDLTNYFDANRVANDEDSQFITDTLVNNPLLGAPANGGGITAIYDPKTGVNFRWGIQRSDSASTGLTEEVFSVIEIGYLSHFITIPEGHYRVWYRFDKDLGKENMAYGFSIDQKLSASLTLFGRFGHKFTSDQFQDDDFFYSGGFQFKNRYTFSPGDYWAFGYQHTDLGTEIKESLIEGYYNFDLAESFKASFHLQYLFDSNSGGADKSYLLPGLRVHFDF